MDNLTELTLWGNELSGEIPEELGSLTKLEILSLSRNEFTGEIPTELGGLANLEWLYLGDNQLTGPVPSGLGSLAKLQRLSLYDNQLTGPVPTWLGNLTDLQELDLWGNQLTGTIPPEFGRLANLAELYLGDNQLTGTIPPELGRLANLEYLSLTRNQVTGTIPPELARLTNLGILALGGNQLTGPIPTWLGGLANLQELYLSRNQLSGPIPPELGSLANLQRLSLYDNQLTGTIPTGLGSLANLEELFLSGNQLTGCIPAGIAGVANNDLNQLGLPFCTGARGAPTISAVTPGTGFLTVAWAAPGGPSESATITYDLRHIESAAGDKAGANWTVVEDVWTTGSGALDYQVSGLTDWTQYYLQVRSVNADGDGPWSATATGTPATWWAIRSFSPASVVPGGELVVTAAAAAGYGASGLVKETLLPGFSYGSSSLPDGAVTVEGREVSFVLFGETDFTYTVTASSTAGSYSFSGILTNSNGEEVPVGGASRITVEAAPPGVSASRSFSPASVAPGGEVVVTINAASYGVGGAVTETLPEGFTYVSSSLPDSQVSVTGQQVRFTLQGDTSFTYTVTAPSVEGSYAFSGTLRDDEGNVHDVGGDARVTVRAPSPPRPPRPPANSPPTFSTDTATRLVAENSAAATNVGAPVTATDPDGGTLTYTLGGADAGSFTIENRGQMKVGAGTMLDFQTKAGYNVTVRATDRSNASDTIAVTVTVTNVEEMGAVTLSPTTPQVGTAITATLSDPDGGVTGTTWQWSKSDAMDGTFTDISGATMASYTPIGDDEGMYLKAKAMYTDMHGPNKMAMMVMSAAVGATGGGDVLTKYDADNSGDIQKPEYLEALDHYIAGDPDNNNQRISKATYLEVLDLYISALAGN